MGLLDHIGRLFHKDEVVPTSLGQQWISEELERSLSRMIASTLREQRDNGTPNGLYEMTLVKFVFNHERIEGNALTEWQTQEVFETRDLVLSDATTPSAVRETANHTLMFDELIGSIEEPLSKGLIRRFHRQLMDGVMGAAGEWKTLPNGVGGIATCPPAEVDGAMGALLDAYVRHPTTLENIARLHVRFETIHPFADGNGRVDRAIVFRECLRGGLVPLIVSDETKADYYAALGSYRTKGSPEDLVGYFVRMRRDYASLAIQLIDDDVLKEAFYRELPDLRPLPQDSLEFAGEPVEPEKAHNPALRAESARDNEAARCDGCERTKSLDDPQR